MPYIVALTGGIGSGKSTIAEHFAKLGAGIVDADIIARLAVEKGSDALTKIAAHFGENILNEHGELNRKALREHIFNNDAERLWLNQLLHPIILQMTFSHFDKIDAPYILWVVPLLIETDLQKYADRVLVIDVDPKVQLNRIIQRDNIDENLAKKMLLSQLSNKERLQYANDIIKNNNGIDKLPPIINKLHQKYIALANNKK